MKLFATESLLHYRCHQDETSIINDDLHRQRENSHRTAKSSGLRICVSLQPCEIVCAGGPARPLASLSETIKLRSFVNQPSGYLLQDDGS
jgi:hypothetical protein